MVVTGCWGGGEEDFEEGSGWEGSMEGSSEKEEVANRIPFDVPAGEEALEVDLLSSRQSQLTGEVQRQGSVSPVRRGGSPEIKGSRRREGCRSSISIFMKEAGGERRNSGKGASQNNQKETKATNPRKKKQKKATNLYCVKT